MKKTLLLIGLAGIVCASASATPLRIKKHDSPRHAESKIAKARANVRKIAKVNENALVWFPGHMTQFWWDDWSDTPGWKEGSSLDYTYYDNGLLKSELDEYQLRVYTYDELGRVINEEYYSYDYDYQTGEQTEEMVLGSVYTYEYDPIVTDYVILETEKSRWNDWQPSIYGTEITRNAEGNVTNVRDYRLREDGTKSYDSEQFVVKYGSDGKACEVYYMDDYDGETEYSDHLTDIVWENTDGQILGIEFDDYDSDSFFGANRIKAATFIDEDLGTVLLTVEYDGESFSGEMEYQGEVASSFDYKVLDSHGSFSCEANGSWYDIDEDSMEPVLIAHDHTIFGELYDSYGLLLEDTYESETNYADGEVELIKEGGKGTVAYDSTYGYPLEYSFAWYDGETGSYVNSERKTYSDYHSYYPNGVETIGNADREAEYFTLQGVKVANPVQGIYIVRRGGKTFKAVIR